MKTKVTFAQVYDVAVDSQKRVVLLWNTVALFAASTLTDQIKKASGPEGDKGEALRAAFKGYETEAETAHGEKAVKLNEIGAYRSAKSVISAAARYGVPLMEKGKVRGKTEVEKAVKDLREKPTPLENFNRALTMAENVVKEIGDKADIAVAYGRTKALLEKVTAIAKEKMGVKEVDKAAQKALGATGTEGK